jgi:hypothetical protein
MVIPLINQGNPAWGVPQGARCGNAAESTANDYECGRCSSEWNGTSARAMRRRSPQISTWSSEIGPGRRSRGKANSSSQ